MAGEEAGTHERGAKPGPKPEAGMKARVDKARTSKSASPPESATHAASIGLANKKRQRQKENRKRPGHR
jgi:hypothetical protein